MRRMRVTGFHPEPGMQDSERLGRVLPDFPQMRHVLQPICISLAQLPWDKPTIQAHLKTRLPLPLQHLAEPMARRLARVFPGSVAPDAPRILQALQSSGSADQILTYARTTNTLPALVLTSPAFLPAAPFANLPLPHLTTTTELEEWLALPDGQLTRFADLRGLSAKATDAFAPHYCHHLIPKSDGHLRLIEEPKPLLKHLQRRILHGLLDLIPPHDAAFGFVPHRNAIMGATRHVGEAMVVAFDLADFFPAIPFARIYALFRTIGYPRAVALHLSGMTTAITPQHILRTPNLAAPDALSARHLPQGAPTSPALANLCALTLDRRLTGLARSLNATYTRYADDLTFSGDAHIALILLRAVPDIIRDTGFRLNPHKTRVMPAHTRQIVTGLNVNQRVNIPRPTYDLLKSTIHHLSHPTDPRRHDRTFLVHLAGQIAWLEQVHPQHGARLRDALATALT
jgi:RNA-directed DNA polymerase